MYKGIINISERLRDTNNNNTNNIVYIYGHCSAAADIGAKVRGNRDVWGAVSTVAERYIIIIIDRVRIL